MAKPPLVELTELLPHNHIPGGYVLVEGHALRKILRKANERDNFHNLLRAINNHDHGLTEFFQDYPE